MQRGCDHHHSHLHPGPRPWAGLEQPVLGLQWSGRVSDGDISIRPRITNWSRSRGDSLPARRSCPESLGGARGALVLTASRPLSCAPLARRASLLDLRSISSMMPWMWPPEMPWKSMAGGRKGHASSSARHPTISIYTRAGLSAHPSEAAARTAEEAPRWPSAEARSGWETERTRGRECGRKKGVEQADGKRVDGPSPSLRGRSSPGGSPEGDARKTNSGSGGKGGE